MISITAADDLFTANRDAYEPHEPRAQFERPPFLATPRAMSVCAREIGRIADALVAGAAALPTSAATDTAVARQSPGRCIVQLGPVAIIMTWLRSNLRSVEDGELLVILCCGVVAPRGEHYPERPPAHRPPSTATALWEQTLRPVASSEATWVWEAAPDGEGDRAWSSSELAAHCVERLRVAYAARCAPDGRLPA